MADLSQSALPRVRLELRHGGGRPTVYDIAGLEFRIGSGSDCELRLSGAALPPIVAVITRHAAGAQIRKLANLPLTLNGRDFHVADLRSGDLLAMGPLTMLVAIEGASPLAIQFAPIDESTVPRSVSNSADMRAPDASALVAREHRLTAAEAELARAKLALDEREQAIERQQAILTELRSRLEQTRDEVRREAALLVEQRAQQDATRRDLDERGATLQKAVAQLREMEQRFQADAGELERRRADLDRQAGDLVAREAELRAQAERLAEWEARIAADRTALSERGAALGQSDEARRLFQEQLQRRADELAAREKGIEETARQQAAASEEIERLRSSVLQARTDMEEKWAAAQKEWEARAQAVAARAADLDAREDTLRRHVEKLRAVGAAVAAERKANYLTQSRWATEQQALVAEADALRAELDAYRRRAAEDSEQLQRQLPEVELRGEAALARLAQARDQLRAHLAELHDYADQCRADLQRLRAQLQIDLERLRSHEAAIQRDRSEHRLAVTAFRQQLIEWQGRIAEIRQSLQQDAARLNWKEAEVASAARQIDATSEQLARQSAALSEQEKQVAERRSEVERHLADMREWYRRKLRDLAQSTGAESTKETGETAVDETPRPAPPAICGTITAANDEDEDLDPADRRLGEWLRSLDLVDAPTLGRLWQEARRQRRPLRQVLLAGRDGGAPILTLYQLALIEAGQLDALALGPLRVVDRVAAHPKETIFRVFDPRRGSPGLLRHLAESEAAIAGRADEFQRRFAAAAGVRHDNVAATLEVLELQGRPAALQEWVGGLSAADWPAAAGTPGVWYRLVMQVALGLDAAHRAGLTHGHLSPRTVLLTNVGVVKIIGVGDPPWLAGVENEGTVAGDLIALGGLAAGWAALNPRRRGKSARSWPAPLRSIVDRLAPDAADRFASAADVLAALEHAGGKLPDDSDAWDELLDHVSQDAGLPTVWRKSA